MGGLGVHLEMDHLLNQILRVSYLTYIHNIYIIISDEEKSDTLWYLN